MNTIDAVTLEMAYLCEQHAVNVDGALATRLLRYAGAMRKCKPNSRCRMDACPRCIRRHVKKNANMVEALIRGIAPESLRVLVFAVPVTTAPSDLENVLDRVDAAFVRLTKGNTLWARYFSRWAGQVRAKLKPTPTPASAPIPDAGEANSTVAAFLISIRFVVEVKPTFDLTELEERWRLLLHSLGLAIPDPGDAPLVKVVEPKGDARQQARCMCRSATSWLTPIKKLPAPEAIAYQKVLPGLLRLRAQAATP
jgi:hypothetical protein